MRKKPGRDEIKKGPVSKRSLGVRAPSFESLSGVDRILTSDDIAIRDDKGRMRILILEEVQIRFDGNLDLQIRYDRLVDPAKSDGAKFRAYIESRALYAGEDMRRAFREAAKMDEQGEEAAKWREFLDDVGKWAKEDGYSWEREKVYAAVLHQYGSLVQDYTKFWKESEAKIRE